MGLVIFFFIYEWKGRISFFGVFRIFRDGNVFILDVFILEIMFFFKSIENNGGMRLFLFFLFLNIRVFF